MRGPNVDKILAAKAGSITINDAIEADTIAKVGENMSLRRAAELFSRQRRDWQLRAQCTVSDGLGRIGVLVALESNRQER